MDNRTIEEIRKNEDELIKILDYQKNKLDQYKNNWEELKKWLKKAVEIYNNIDVKTLLMVLDKMKELEEDK